MVLRLERFVECEKRHGGSNCIVDEEVIWLLTLVSL
jgi:hypothetical protein